MTFALQSLPYLWQGLLVTLEVSGLVVFFSLIAGTIMGVETNSMQFYPEASLLEEAVHPGIYKRRDGKVNLTTIQGPGFGYQVDKIKRNLPAPAADFG